MLDPIFSALGSADHILRLGVPPWAALCIWGVLSGAAVMGFYALISPQKGIRLKKEQIRELQAALKDPDLDFASTMKLSRKNLARSLELLGLVILPSAASMAPALLMILFMALNYTYRPPAAGESIKVEVSPPIQSIAIESGGAVTGAGDGSFMVLPGGSGFSVREAGRMIYTWAPGDPMDSTVGKRPWWGFLYSGPGGYLPGDSGAEAIRLGFPRLRVLGFGPAWMVTWEFTYLIALAVAAIAVKAVFRIH